HRPGDSRRQAAFGGLVTARAEGGDASDGRTGLATHLFRRGVEEAMKLARYVYLALLVIALLALGVWQLFPGQADADRGESKVPPRFVVDPDWPKQLPNNWLIWPVGGLAGASHKTIWLLSQSRT